MGVGLFKNGEKRYEIRHLNDLKLAHPDSLASPAQRPALGRPSKQTEAQPSSSRVVAPPSKSDVPFPNPTSTGRVLDAAENKQIGNNPDADHATSIPSVGSPSSTANEEFQGVITGPPPARAFSGRAVRSTRNPAPKYVDSFWLAAALC